MNKKIVAQKQWRVNVWIIFMDKTNTHLNRERAQNVLSHLAWLYKLEFAISSDKKVDGLPFNMPVEPTQDLVYFRSTANTGISARKFREIVNILFQHLNPFIDGFEVSISLMNQLYRFPFPENYQVWGY